MITEIVLCVLLAISAIDSIGDIGKERPPRTVEGVRIEIILVTLIIVGLLTNF